MEMGVISETPAAPVLGTLFRNDKHFSPEVFLIEPVCFKMWQKKSPVPEFGLGNRGPLEALNDIKLEKFAIIHNL